jgi:hypothetical protein
MIKIDNFISKELQDSIEAVVTSRMFHWYYDTGTIDISSLDATTEKLVLQQGSNPFQFIHVAVRDSRQNTEFFQLIESVVEQLATTLKSNIEIKRAKFNLLTESQDQTHHYPHVDLDSVEDKDIKTAIYYVNDSNGDTYIFNETAPLVNPIVTINERITPKKGSAIIFDSNIFHCSSSPTTGKRIVLNIVFKIVK